MNCVACGAEMILVSVVPDETMIVKGFERYTMQCLGCGDQEERFLFNAANGHAAQMAAQAAAAAVEHAEPPMATAWLRAVERLRGRQTEVTQRRAEQEKADRVTQFYREWEELIPNGQRPSQIKVPPRPKGPHQIRGTATARAEAAAGNGRPLSSWERAVAKLRARQERG